MEDVLDQQSIVIEVPNNVERVIIRTFDRQHTCIGSGPGPRPGTRDTIFHLGGSFREYQEQKQKQLQRYQREQFDFRQQDRDFQSAANNRRDRETSITRDESARTRAVDLATQLRVARSPVSNVISASCNHESPKNN